MTSEFSPKWIQRSRDTRFLVRFSIGLVGASVLLSLLLSVLTRPGPPEVLDTNWIPDPAVSDAGEPAPRAEIINAWKTGETGILRELLADPLYRDSLSAAERMTMRADLRDYRGLAKDTLLSEIDRLTSPMAVPALLTSAIWFLILMAFWNPDRTRVGMAALAFLSGIVSAALTLFVVMLQERIQGFTENPTDTDMGQFLYWITGVALREETLKLLCFVPFAIWASRRKSDVEGLILAAATGLGFSFQENIGYFAEVPGNYVAWGRFLTANPLHFSLTGIAGFYLYRMIRRKFHGMEAFLAAFIAVVFAHGIYNAVQSIPSYSLYGSLAPIFVAVIAYRFFDPLRGVMDTDGIGRRLSPLGVFVIGSALLACVALIGASFFLPYRFALGFFAISLGSLLPTAFAFISRFRDL